MHMKWALMASRWICKDYTIMDFWTTIIVGQGSRWVRIALNGGIFMLMGWSVGTEAQHYVYCCHWRFTHYIFWSDHYISGIFYKTTLEGFGGINEHKTELFDHMSLFI